jgi:hypothetical protein
MPPRKLYVSPRAVQSRRVKNMQQWEQIFKEIIILGSCTAAAKLHPGITVRTIQRRYNIYKRRQTTEKHLPDPSIDHRGEADLIFTPQQELLLANNIRAIIDSKSKPVTKETFRHLAIDYYRYVHPAQRCTRTIGMTPFRASDGWIQRFKARHQFSSRQLYPVKKVKESVKNDLYNAKLDYVCEIEEAVQQYGLDCVLNFDECPAKTCEIPKKSWGYKGQTKNHVATWGNIKLNVTILPIVSANGDLLKFSWINKGKTYCGVSKMKNLPVNSNAYFSESGWINGGIVVRIIREIIAPYLAGKPGALIVDDYEAHWTPEVRKVAASFSIELIKVPPGTTGEFQPLDISVMGPMKQYRIQMAVTDRYNSISVLDNVEETVNRAFRAFNKVTTDTILKGWRTACPPLEEIYEQQKSC